MRMLGRLIFYATQHAADAGKRMGWLEPSVRPQPAPEPAPLTSADIWTRTTAPIVGALAGLGRVHELQGAAAAQVDAADYVLGQLVADLATVMPMPADTAPLRAILAQMAEVTAQAPAAAEPAAKPAAGKAMAA
jgi:hypothetical protein